MRKPQVKKADLQERVDLLNKTIGEPLDLWITDDRGDYVRDDDGRLTYNHGTLILGYANGGVALEKRR